MRSLACCATLILACSTSPMRFLPVDGADAGLVSGNRDGSSDRSTSVIDTAGFRLPPTSADAPEGDILQTINQVEAGPASPKGFASVSAGSSFTCGVKTDGTLACWGMDGVGQTTPPSGTFVSVSVGSCAHACGVRTNGTIACWGSNGSNASKPPTGTFTYVGAGCDHTCGIRSDGTVACWGLNDVFQTEPPAGTFVSIGVGANYACGIRPDGTPLPPGTPQSLGSRRPRAVRAWA
jgi:hypothetical protein